MYLDIVGQSKSNCFNSPVSFPLQWINFFTKFWPWNCKCWHLCMVFILNYPELHTLHTYTWLSFDLASYSNCFNNLCKLDVPWCYAITMLLILWYDNKLLLRKSNYTFLKPIKNQNSIWPHHGMALWFYFIFLIFLFYFNYSCILHSCCLIRYDAGSWSDTLLCYFLRTFLLLWLTWIL